MKILLFIPLALAMAIPAVFGASPFVDHGAPANLSESRGSLLVHDRTGKTLFLVALRDVLPDKWSRASFLIFDPETRESTQYFPGGKDVANGDSYSLFVSKAGRLYFSSSSSLYEFDLAERKVLKSFKDLPGPAMSMDEDAEGRIYLAVYPTAELLRYSPDTQKLEKLAQLDAHQKYPTSLAVDDLGWVYVGLGTVRATLIGYNPKSGETRVISQSPEGTPGNASVARSQGKVYGRVNPKADWALLNDGKLIASEGLMPPEEWRKDNSMYWLSTRWQNQAGLTVRALSLENRTLEWTSPDGKRNEARFDYETAGAEISSLTVGNDGKIYGSSAHPMRLWSFNPVENQLRTEGAVPRIGSGNLTKVVPWKNLIVGNSYSKGDFYAYDPANPVDSSQDSSVNPALIVSSSPEIRRPRGLLAHPDGRHIISTGFPGYGEVGGGMLIVDMETRETVALLSAKDLVPNQSLASLTALSDGTILAGSTITTPGGADPVAKEAVVAAFDLPTRRVLWTVCPVPGAPFIIGLATLANGCVAGVTSTADFFVLDPSTRKVVRQQKVENLGGVASARADTSFVRAENGSLLLVLQKGIVEVSEDGTKLTTVAESPVPISNVGRVLEGRLYFSQYSHLWSFELPPKFRAIHQAATRTDSRK